MVMVAVSCTVLVATSLIDTDKETPFGSPVENNVHDRADDIVKYVPVEPEREDVSPVAVTCT